MLNPINGIGNDFLQQMHQIIEEADGLLVERAAEYNRGGVTLHDQCNCCSQLPPSLSYWTMLHIRFFRLKSLMNGDASLEKIYETLRDLINETRFLYAELKTTLPDDKDVMRDALGNIKYKNEEG